jgi:hypothetical protein
VCPAGVVTVLHNAHGLRAAAVLHTVHYVVSVISSKWKIFKGRRWGKCQVSALAIFTHLMFFFLSSVDFS